MNWLKKPISPMLATLVDKVPSGDYQYEVKWDGIRAIVTVDQGDIRIRSRNKNDITNRFPELQDAKAFQVKNGVFDGEIVCVDAAGKPSFQKIIKRLKTTSPAKIKRLAKSQPVQCYSFDCLYLDEELLITEPLKKRYEILNDVLNEGAAWRISETVEDGDALFQAIQEHNMEGIMAKKLDSRYIPGKRSTHWQKIKVRKTSDCLVIGYTTGKGDRSQHFGALHLAEESEAGIVYRGKVGTGFSIASMNEVYSELSDLEETDRPEYAPPSKDTVWVIPALIAEISYSSLTPDKVFRDPVYHRMRPDMYQSF